MFWILSEPREVFVRYNVSGSGTPDDWVDVLGRVILSRHLWSIPLIPVCQLFPSYGNIELPPRVESSMNPPHKVHYHVFCCLQIAVNTQGTLFRQYASLGSSLANEGSSFFSSCSSTWASSFANPSTSFSISFSSSSILVLSFLESLLIVSVSFLMASSALLMILSLSHLFRGPASSGTVLRYLPGEQSSSSGILLNKKASQLDNMGTFCLAILTTLVLWGWSIMPTSLRCGISLRLRLLGDFPLTSSAESMFKSSLSPPRPAGSPNTGSPAHLCP